MRVRDVPTRDWSLYFNDTYMKYKGEIVKVSIVPNDGRTTFACQPSGGGVEYIWRKADLENLEVWWPRPGAYNLNGQAAYIARKANRCMRKSCVPRSHYYFKYGEQMGLSVMYFLKRGPNHMTWKAAEEALVKGVVNSVAVCRDLILTRVKDGFGVVYRGEEAGKVVDGQYYPENDFQPITKLVNMRLVEEGIV